MKTQTKINIFMLVMLTLLGAPLVISGYLVINEIVYKLNQEMFSKELNHINQGITRAYQVLEEAGVADIEGYVRQEQEKLLKQFSNYHYDSTGRLFILDAQSRILWHQDYPKGQLFPFEFAQTMLAQKQGAVEYYYQGQSYYSVFLTAPQWHWLIALTITQEEMFAGRQRYVQTALLIAAIVLLSVLWLSYRITRRISQQIQTTLDYLQKFEQGSLQTRIPVVVEDEIGVIQAGINTMVAKIEVANAVMRNEIEQRRQMEGELRIAKEQAEKANQEKTQLVANISHELRTPMNGILGITELVLETSLTLQQHRYLRVIYESGHILLNIINELLDVFKLEAGKVELETTAFDLLQLAEDVTLLMHQKVREKGLTLEITSAPSLPRLILGDKNRLRQVLLNLVGNAIKFTPQGKVTIDIKVNQLEQEQVHFTISVIDTGIGIPIDKQHKLFKKFSQIEVSTSREYGGTGLGLYICQQLVELMGGNLGVTSALGKGCTMWFTLQLPRVKAETPVVIATIPTKSAVPVVDLKPVHILLVEDNKTNQMVTKIMLNKQGCQVSIANHGEEALMMITQQYYDLVFMDVQMPILDGYAATRMIRQREQQTQTHLIIIAMTANASSHDVETCLAAGMDDLVAKPISQTILVNTLEKWLRAS